MGPVRNVINIVRFVQVGPIPTATNVLQEYINKILIAFITIVQQHTIKTKLHLCVRNARSLATNVQLLQKTAKIVFLLSICWESNV